MSVVPRPSTVEPPYTVKPADIEHRYNELCLISNFSKIAVMYYVFFTSYMTLLPAYYVIYRTFPLQVTAFLRDLATNFAVSE